MTSPYSSQTLAPPMLNAVPVNQMMQIVPGQKVDAIPLQSVAETLKAFGYGQALPFDQSMYWTGEGGWQMEKPLTRYRSGLLPYVDQIFVLRWDRTAEGGLECTPTTVSGIQLFQQGVGDGTTTLVGSSMGIWWVITSADSTFETGGAPVYDGNSFFAFGHTIAFEGVYSRGGDPDAPLATDSKKGLEMLDDGPGSYSELMLQRAAFDVAIQMSNQGSGCIQFLDVLGANGDRAQLIGGGRHSISLPVFPYARWMRPGFFGASNQFMKMSGTLISSVTMEIGAIAGNEIPEDLLSVYQQFRIRVYGLRVCGNPADGC